MPVHTKGSMWEGSGNACVTTIPSTIKIRGEHFIYKFTILVFKDIT